jgi:hypothetical protein
LDFAVAGRKARTAEKQVPRLSRNGNFFQKLSKNSKGTSNSKGKMEGGGLVYL